MRALFADARAALPRHLEVDRDELALAGGLAAILVSLLVLYRSQTQPHCPSGYVLQDSQCVAA